MSYTSQISEWQLTMVLDSKTSTPPTSSPTVKSPTSAPKSSSDKERRPKLRASCDACAASKVKCNKQHPICGRCLANGSQCIYGVSRKHGKPGRTRKRNPDGTPFIKASKQRCSPDGSKFGKFRIRHEPVFQPFQPLPDLYETASNWSSNWSSTPSLPGTPDDFEFEMTPEPFYTDASDLSFMDDILLPTAQLEPDVVQSIEPELTFRDLFAKRQSVQLDLPDIQGLDSYLGGDSLNPIDYSFEDPAIDPALDPYIFSTASSLPQSPKITFNGHSSMRRVSISMPRSHCCYTLAYSTLESLRIIGSDATNTYAITECKSLDNVLSITQLAVESVFQLLSCPCSSDPHLAMLYSSIVSKLLTWYQIAAGVNVTATAAAPPSFSSSSASPESSVGFSSPLPTPISDTEMAFNISLQPVQFSVYQFDEAEQQRLRRQVVLRELKNCGQLVDALANWRGDGASEFLYDMLGAWLKNELYKTVQEVEGAQAL